MPLTTDESCELEILFHGFDIALGAAGCPFQIEPRAIRFHEKRQRTGALQKLAQNPEVPRQREASWSAAALRRFHREPRERKILFASFGYFAVADFTPR
jgi:hypothetical protein